MALKVGQSCPPAPMGAPPMRILTASISVEHLVLYMIVQKADHSRCELEIGHSVVSVPSQEIGWEERLRSNLFWRWPSKSNEGWRASTARTLNRDEVMKVWRLCSCEHFVGKWEELVFDAYIDSEPVEREGVWHDLGALTTVRAREFCICWTRHNWDLGSL